jgi:opacity protein-like surface antigen
MRPFALACALAVAAVSPVLAQDIPDSEFEAGNWYGAAVAGDRGAFSHCYTSVGYVNGQTLWVGLYPNDTLSILLSQPDVRFRPGQKFELWVMMETGLPAIGNGEAWDEAYAGITYDGIQPTIDFLNSGRYLRMLGMGIDDGFDVEGIGPALAQAQDCLARQGGAGADSGKVLGGAPGGVKAPPKVPDLSKPKTSGVGSGGGLGTRPGGALGTPAPKPQP